MKLGRLFLALAADRAEDHPIHRVDIHDAGDGTLSPGLAIRLPYPFYRSIVVGWLSRPEGERMKRTGLALLAALAVVSLPAQAEEVNPPTCQAAGYTGTAAVVTRGERSEFVTARGSIGCSLTKKLGVFSRLELGGTQDGGGLAFGDPKTFRAVESVVGVRYTVGPLRVSLIGGTTLSAEGEKDAPVDARLYTAGGTVGLGFGDGGYVELGGAFDERVDGAAVLFSASVPIKGAYTVLDASVPIKRGAFAERTWQLRVGAQLRVFKKAL